jgi:4-hydroxy-tetrahydrodipicolinate synthase
MARVRPVFDGVATSLVTVFRGNGDLDASATGDLAAALVEAGVRAVVVADVWGEGPSLTPDERIALVKAVRAAVPESSKVPVIAATGAPSARQAGQLTRAAVTNGADAVLVLSPPLTADARAYYVEAATAAEGAPVIAAHHPRLSWPGLEVADVPDLRIDGYVDGSGDPERLLEALIVFDGATYTGSTAVLSLAGPAGATGAILGLANAEPERCAAAFGGDGVAQRELVRDHVAIHVDFPERIKVLTARRFGTSTATRMG